MKLRRQQGRYAQPNDSEQLSVVYSQKYGQNC
jgi:hypothetical protein